jgi:uncharacterized RmlC-like cupin family protein
VLDAINHTLFPHYSATVQKHGLEVVLHPGDMLYIPPYWFHHVTVVSDGSSPDSCAVRAHPPPFLRGQHSVGWGETTDR